MDNCQRYLQLLQVALKAYISSLNKLFLQLFEASAPVLCLQQIYLFFFFFFWLDPLCASPFGPLCNTSGEAGIRRPPDRDDTGTLKMSLFCIKMPGSAQLLELHCCAWISIVWLELNKLSGFAQFGWNKISCLDFHS